MKSRIRLKPTNSTETYVVLLGKPSIKNVGGERKEVTPLSTARFHYDILARPPSDSIMFMYDNGFRIDDSMRLPAVMSPNIGSVEMYRKGDLLVLSTDSDSLVDSHRVLGIVGELPEINGENISDVRTAEDYVNAYRSYQSEVAARHWLTRLEWLKEAIHLKEKTKVPKEPKGYEGKIDSKVLAEILQSFPQDSKGSALAYGEKTDLVIASPALAEDELAYLLEHPEELDELRKYQLHTDGIIRGVTLVDTPVMVSDSEALREGQTIEGFSADRYNASLRGRKLRELLRRAGYANANGLILSPVQIGSIEPKQVFGPKKVVTYLQGVQAIDSSSDGVVIGGEPYVKGLAFRYNDGVALGEHIERADGVAGVAVFEKTEDMRQWFSSPVDADSFDGDINAEGKAIGIFERYFREDVKREAERLGYKKGTKINGVVLSPIGIEQHMVDVLIHIARDPIGEFRLAATYLV